MDNKSFRKYYQQTRKYKTKKIDDLLKYLDNNYYEDNDSKRKFKKYLANKVYKMKKQKKLF